MKDLLTDVEYATRVYKSRVVYIQLLHVVNELQYLVFSERVKRSEINAFRFLFRVCPVPSNN